MTLYKKNHCLVEANLGNRQALTLYKTIMSVILDCKL